MDSYRDQDDATFASKAKQNKYTTEHPNRTKLPKGTLPVLASEVLVVNDLHWWTAHHHVIDAAKEAGVFLRREDVTSTEHKVNGKTKGSFYLTCRSIPEAQKLASWFKAHEFQGRKVSTAFVNQSAVQTLKTPAAVSTNPRPAMTAASLAQHPPTNAHGGINFNRLRQHNRGYQAQGGHIGLGHPSARTPQSKTLSEGVPIHTWSHANPWATLDPYNMQSPVMHAIGHMPIGLPYGYSPEWAFPSLDSMY